MLDTNITVLLPTLLGGILTIIGGFIAVFYTQLIANTKEKRKEARDLLETMYNKTQIIEEHYTNYIMKIESEEFMEKDRIITSSISQLALVIDIYVEPLKNSFHTYIEGISDVDYKLTIFKYEEDKNAAIKYIIDTLSKATITFRKEIVKLLKKKGYSYF